MLCRIDKKYSKYLYFEAFHWRFILTINNLVCTVHYSVLGLKICTLPCSVISVKSVFFLLQLRALPSFWSVVFMSCIFMSCNCMPCKFVRHFDVRHFQSTLQNCICRGRGAFTPNPAWNGLLPNEAQKTVLGGWLDGCIDYNHVLWLWQLTFSSWPAAPLTT